MVGSYMKGRMRAQTPGMLDSVYNSLHGNSGKCIKTRSNIYI